MSRLALRFAALGYLGALLLAPVGLVFYRTFEHGVGAVWDSITTPAAISVVLLALSLLVLVGIRRLGGKETPV